MNTRRLIPMVIHTGLLTATLVLSMSSVSFGERAVSTPVNTSTVQAETSYQQNARSESAISSESMGFRSAESEGETTVAPLVPLQRSLSVNEPKLVETTDASGGTMIQLQGKFQCGLKVPQKRMNMVVEPTLSPVTP